MNRNGVCAVCGNPHGDRRHIAREMFFGLRERFTYVECDSCGCLQIGDIPADMSRYYPGNYYSFVAPPMAEGLRGVLARLRDRVLRPAWIPTILAHHFPGVRYADIGLTRRARILDVGCGAGTLLSTLRWAGYSRLLGVDPYANDSRRNGVTIKRQTIEATSGKWDLVMFHHSLEHMADQAGALAAARRLLTPGGTCVVRIPIASYAWKEYGTDWYGLEAPRHFFVHTKRSFTLVAERVGFTVRKIFDDSNEAQFAFSEMYRRDIPLFGSHHTTLFAEAELRAFSERARQLNEEGQGDQTAFYLSA